MDAQEINDFEEMFSTNGWSRMEKDAVEAIQQRESQALQAKNIEEVRYWQGEAAQLAILVNLRGAVEFYKERLREGADE